MAGSMVYGTAFGGAQGVVGDAMAEAEALADNRGYNHIAARIGVPHACIRRAGRRAASHHTCLRRAQQDVAHRRRVPLAAALRGRHPRLVQVISDLPQRITTRALTLDPPHHRLRERRRTAEPNAGRACFTASASLVRCEISRRSNCANVASMFAIASPAGVDVSTATSKRDQRPVLLLRLRHHPGEVDHRTREPIQLRHHQRVRLPLFQRPQRLLHARTAHVLRGVAATPSCLCRPRCSRARPVPRQPAHARPRDHAHPRPVQIRLDERPRCGRGEAPLRHLPRGRVGIALAQMGNANPNPWTESKVDTKNPERGALLIIDGRRTARFPGRSPTPPTSGRSATRASPRSRRCPTAATR